jgi:hypothetical protein
MVKKLLTSIVLILLLSTAYGEETSLIKEDVDEIMIVYIENGNDRVIFFRGDSILATRSLRNDMLFTSEGDKFLLIWSDYYPEHDRCVSTKVFTTLYCKEDPYQQDRGPWWNMFRNMRDLKQP